MKKIPISSWHKNWIKPVLFLHIKIELCILPTLLQYIEALSMHKTIKKTASRPGKCMTSNCKCSLLNQRHTATRLQSEWKAYFFMCIVLWIEFNASLSCNCGYHSIYHRIKQSNNGNFVVAKSRRKTVLPSSSVLAVKIEFHKLTTNSWNY